MNPLPVPESEFYTRIEGTRRRMREEGYDALLLFSGYLEREGNICYLTNYRSAFPPSRMDENTMGPGYPALLLPSDGPITLFVSFPPRPETMVGVSEVRVTANTPAAVSSEVRKSGLKLARVGLVGADIVPHFLYLGLQREVKGVSFEVADDILYAQRMVKSESELKVMREAAAAADRGFEAAVRASREGVSEYEVGLAAIKACMEAGADYVARTRLYSGEGSAIEIKWPLASRKKLKSGENVGMDLVGWHNNYAFDVFRCWVVGRPSEELKELLTAGAEATEAQVKAVRAGVTGEELDRALRAYIDGTRFREHVSPHIHSIGIDVVEKLITPKDVLKRNMVVCVEPGIVVPGFAGVRFEDEVIVGETGPEVITKYPKTL